MIKKSKYNAKKVEYNGLTFDSKLELTIWQYLEQLAKNGEISNLDRQVKFEVLPKNNLYRAVIYVADFVFEYRNVKIFADAKGMILPEFKLKQKMFYAKYGTPITVFKSKKDVQFFLEDLKQKLF